MSLVLSAGCRKWPATYVKHDERQQPYEWTVHWSSGTHQFTIADDDAPPVLSVSPHLAFFDHDEDSSPTTVTSITNETPADREIYSATRLPTSPTAASLFSSTPDAIPPLNIDKLPRSSTIRNHYHHHASRISSCSSTASSSLSIMDRGRPVRKSSAACWPGVGRTHGSQPAEEWKKEMGSRVGSLGSCFDLGMGDER